MKESEKLKKSIRKSYKFDMRKFKIIYKFIKSIIYKIN